MTKGVDQRGHLLRREHTNRAVHALVIALFIVQLLDQFFTTTGEIAGGFLALYRSAGEQEMQRFPRLVEIDVQPEGAMLGAGGTASGSPS